ncbi:IgGFc-binding protein [Collichthys lucidus]|uniref:IgGFc-binding protein n=1 Tax=Collichthys lucidus TaxID=240159 RepID=A0A4U5VMJ3_COLLU|nr:IgGFc-binding protein [Collichthys lucidus]
MLGSGGGRSEGLCSSLPAGREFATSFLQNLGSDDSATHFIIAVTALPTSQGSTKVKVTAVGQIYEKEMNPGKSVSFKLPDSEGSKKSRQIVLIEASQDVTVMSLNFRKYTADTSVVYPVKDWGIYVQASQNTRITINTNGEVQSYPMFAGQSLELYSQWPHAMYLTFDKGIQVLFEFNRGSNDALDFYDPFLMTILPTNHFGTSYSLEGQDDFYNNIIVVTRTNDLDGITIDPKPQFTNFKWQKVDGSDFSWAEM